MFTTAGRDVSIIGADSGGSVYLLGNSTGGVYLGTHPTQGTSKVFINLNAGNLPDASCVQGEIGYDTSGTAELCVCLSTNNWQCMTTHAID